MLWMFLVTIVLVIGLAKELRVLIAEWQSEQRWAAFAQPAWMPDVNHPEWINLSSASRGTASVGLAFSIHGHMEVCMRDHPFVYFPFLIGLTLLLGATFVQLKPKSAAPPQNVAVTEVLQWY
jgi:hypothetical protein